MAVVRLNAFPTRRYRVDPQAVRTALRVLARGEGLGLYPEAELSWDGCMQPLRRGALRLLLKASYDVVPRWSRRVGRGTVRVRFGPTFELGRHDDRASREAALAGCERRVRRALSALVAEGGTGERVRGTPGVAT